MNTTENLRLWLRSCPALSEGNRFGIDFLGSNSTEYALYATPTAMTYKKDILGEVRFDSIQTLNYVFACRLPYSRDIQGNQENYDLFAAVVRWIEAQNISKAFPEIEEGAVLSIMPTLSPYVFEAGTDSGRYQIQLAIKYRRKSNVERMKING